MGLNPFILALIGAPTLLGIYLRFSRWSPRILKINVIVSSLVLVAVGIGYVFDHQVALPGFSNGTYKLLGVGFVVAFYSICTIILYAKFEKTNSDIAIGGCYIAVLAGILSVLFLGGLQDIAYIKAPAIIFLFFSFALINSLLGTIAAGFSISSAIYSFITTGSVDYVYIWRDIFEFLEINNTSVKIMVLLVSGLAGCSELLKPLEDKVEALFS